MSGFHTVDDVGERTLRITSLRRFLEAGGPGDVADIPGLVEALERAWGYFEGARDEAMGPRKVRRLEQPVWNPPLLEFVIERHGAMVAGGSTRAELQTWSVDLDDGQAWVSGVAVRQKVPMARRLDVAPLAAEISGLIREGVDDDRLRWSGDHRRVTVRIGDVIPNDGFKQTIEGRRRRFYTRLNYELASAGWTVVRAGTYARGEG